MKSLRNTLYVLLLILVLGAIVLLRPALWHTVLLDRLNETFLIPQQWSLSIGSMKGHFLSYVQAEDVRFINEDGRRIEIPSIKIRVNPITLLFNKINFRSVSIQGIKYSGSLTQSNGDSVDFRLNPQRFILPVTIDNLVIDGNLDISYGDTTYNAQVFLDGSIYSDKYSIWSNINTALFEFQGKQGSLKLNDAYLKISDQTVTLLFSNGKIRDINILGTITYTEQQGHHLQGKLTVQDYQLPESVFSLIPLKPELSSMDINLNFNSDFKNSQGDLHIASPLGLDMSGTFVFETKPTFYQLHDLVLNSADASLAAKGIYEKTGRINGSFNLQNINISHWLISQKNTSISGLLLAEGVLDSGRIQSIAMTTEIRDSSIFQGHMLSLSGSGSFYNNQLVIQDPIAVGVGQSQIEVNGTADFSKKVMSFNCTLQNADPFLINNFWSDTLDAGIINGQMAVTGEFDRPNIDLDLDWRNFVYNDLKIAKGTLLAKMTNAKNPERGTARIVIESANYQKYNVANGFADIIINPDKIIIDQCYLKEGQDYIQFNGFYDRKSALTIDRLQTVYRSHFLVNPEPIRIFYSDAKFMLYPFVLHVDDGIISGEFNNINGFAGNLKLSNINYDLVTQFVPPEYPKLKGTVFGEISTSPGTDSQNLVVDIALKNGTLAGEGFQDLILSFMYQDSVLHVDDITMVGGKSGIQISGDFPVGGSVNSNNRPVDFESRFTNIDLSWFMKFLPPWFQLAGKVTGNLNYNTIDMTPAMEYDLSVVEGKFEKIPLGLVQSKGHYKYRRLWFDSFSSREANGDYLHGKGFLPLDLDPGSETFGQVIEQDSLFIDVAGQTGNLDFLSLYLSDVDSIKGDFKINLTLSGKMDAIMRDGSISVKDGAVYTLLNHDPVRSVIGSAIIKNNIFTIESMSARMHKQGKKGKDNLFISGQLNLDRFFKPVYKISVKGRNLFFDALSEDIKGLVDADITITGKDTLVLAGEVALINVEMFQEFVSEAVGSVLSDDGIIIKYKINFPIKGTFTLLNSQIDAQITGELSYSQVDNFPADYAGELQIEKGKFYYYGDIFTITYGYMAFDNKGFNPYLDIEANTNIDDENIIIRFSGRLDNPALSLESSSGLSQSDILELLTWRKRFEEQEISSTGFGDQAQAILGAWFESQLEKNLSALGDNGLLRLVNNVSISGTSTLLNPNSAEDISIKAGITENLSFAYRRSFSLNAVGVELKLNRYFSVVGNVDETGNFHVKYRLRYSY